MTRIALCLFAISASVTSCGSGPDSAGTWFSPGSPALQVSVVAGCPASVAGYADVVATFPGPPLVPSGPTGGLICRYGPQLHEGPGSAGTGELVSTTKLDQADAAELADAIQRIGLAAPSGAVACPLDVGLVAVIGLTYPHGGDVGLWYHADGCQTLDNGRIGAWEVGNPSFYGGFVDVINQLSPPVHV